MLLVSSGKAEKLLRISDAVAMKNYATVLASAASESQERKAAVQPEIIINFIRLSRGAARRHGGARKRRKKRGVR